MSFRERFWGPPGKISRKRRLLLLITFPVLAVNNGFLGVSAVEDGRTWAAVFNLASATVLALGWIMFYLYPKYSAKNSSENEQVGLND